jgi:hypothetical protein
MFSFFQKISANSKPISNSFIFLVRVYAIGGSFKKLGYNVSLKLLPRSFSLGVTGTTVIYYEFANENHS